MRFQDPGCFLDFSLSCLSSSVGLRPGWHFHLSMYARSTLGPLLPPRGGPPAAAPVRWHLVVLHDRIWLADPPFAPFRPRSLFLLDATRLQMLGMPRPPPESVASRDRNTAHSFPTLGTPLIVDPKSTTDRGPSPPGTLSEALSVYDGSDSLLQSLPFCNHCNHCNHYIHCNHCIFTIIFPL